MATVKISDLPELTAPQSGDFFVVVDSENNVTKKIEASKILNTNSADAAARYAPSFDVSDLSTGQFSFILDTPKTVQTPFGGSNQSLSYDPVRYSVTGLPQGISVRFLTFPITSNTGYSETASNDNALVADQDIFGPPNTPTQTNVFQRLDYQAETVNNIIGSDFNRSPIQNNQTGDLVEAVIRSRRFSDINDNQVGTETYTVSHGGPCLMEVSETVTSGIFTAELIATGSLTFGEVTYQFVSDNAGS